MREDIIETEWREGRDREGTRETEKGRKKTEKEGNSDTLKEESRGKEGG